MCNIMSLKYSVLYVEAGLDVTAYSTMAPTISMPVLSVFHLLFEHLKNWWRQNIWVDLNMFTPADIVSECGITVGLSV